MPRGIRAVRSSSVPVVNRARAAVSRWTAAMLSRQAASEGGASRRLLLEARRLRRYRSATLDERRSETQDVEAQDVHERD